jgi:multiple sugar transport system substrate-binding protein
MEREMNRKSFYIMFSLAMVFTMVLASCAQATPQPAPAATEAPAAPAAPAAPVAGGMDWQQLNGTKITVFLSETPMAVAIRENLQGFKDLTWIDVDYLVVSENDYWSKLTVDLTSGAGQFNVFMSGPTINWGYAAANQIQPLDPFINDPSLTPADWDYDDFFSWAMESNRWDGTPGPAGLGKGELWSVPINAVNNIFTYRKDLFDEWGLQPPSTWDEWASVAREIKEKSGGTVDGKPFYSVAQRGALDITTLSGPFYSGLYSYGGKDFNDDLTPAITSEKSIAFHKLYLDTIKETGSAEWPNMMWFDVQQGFTTGQYAMVFDVADFVAAYEAEGSSVAGKIAFAEPPAGPDGTRLSSVWTWGFSMNAQTKGDEAKAAWLFIMWASDADNMKEFAKTGSWPTRESVWNSPEVKEFSSQWGNFREVFDKIQMNNTAWLVSPMVEASAVENVWVKGFHDYYFNKGSMEDILGKASDDMAQVLKDSGTLK